jgi:SET domain
VFSTHVIKKGERVCNLEPITAIVRRRADDTPVCAHCLRGLASARTGVQAKNSSSGNEGIFFIESYGQIFCSKTCMHAAHDKWNRTLYSVWPGYRRLLQLGSEQDARRDVGTDFFLSQISVMRM